MTPTPHQNEVITKIIEDLITAKDQFSTKDKIISLGGGAGVGKTFSLGYIISHINFINWDIAMTSPTHSSLEVARQMTKMFSKSKADKEIKVSTIHSFLNLRVENDYKTGTTRLKKETKIDVKKCNLLIVDEKSMVGEELFDYILEAVDAGNVGCVLMVGDPYQLPVVNDKMSALDDSHSYTLTEVVRQAKDNPLIKLSMDIRKCIELKRYPKISKLLDRHHDVNMCYNPQSFLESYGKDKTDINFRVIGSYTNNAVDVYNSVIRQALMPNTDYLIPYDKVILQQSNSIKDGNNVTVLHQNGENVEIILPKLKKKVVFGYDLSYYECTDSKKLSFDTIAPESFGTYKEILNNISTKAKNAKGQTKSELWKSFFQIKEEFIEIKRIYASTIHKLQGSSYQSVYADIRDIQSMQGQNDKQDDILFRLLYVLITRSSDKLLILRNA